MNILLIGLGGVGQRHARNIRSILANRVELSAYRVRRLSHVVTSTLEADPNRNVEVDLGIHVFSGLDEALARRPDVAVICNPTSLHVETALACVNAGCDLFIEKPLSDRLEGIEDLVRATDERRRIAMVAYQFRFHPCLRTLASVIASGSLGEVLAVRAIIAEYLPSWHPYEDYRNSYAAKRTLGGGVALTQIHEFDYLYSLFGAVKSVYAIGGHWSHLDIDVEDVSSILMEGTVGNRSLPIHLYQDYVQVPTVRQCEIFGDRGRAVLDFRAVSVTVYTGTSAPIVHSFSNFDRNRPYMDEMRHFLDCVEKRHPPIVGLREGLQSLKMALAAKQSMASRTVVDMAQLDLASLRSGIA